LSGASQLAPDVVEAGELVVAGASVDVVVIVDPLAAFVGSDETEVFFAVVVVVATAGLAFAATALFELVPGISMATATPMDTVAILATRAIDAVVSRTRRATRERLITGDRPLPVSCCISGFPSSAS